MRAALLTRHEQVLVSFGLGLDGLSSPHHVKPGRTGQVRGLIGDDADRTAEDIAENRSVRPPAAWSELDSLHYDLNTCLRESIVTLKCFLRLMPEELFLQFQKQMRGMPTSVAEAQAAKLIGTKSAQNLSAQLITPHPPRY